MNTFRMLALSEQELLQRLYTAKALADSCAVEVSRSDRRVSRNLVEFVDTFDTQDRTLAWLKLKGIQLMEALSTNIGDVARKQTTLVRFIHTARDCRTHMQLTPMAKEHLRDVSEPLHDVVTAVAAQLAGTMGEIGSNHIELAETLVLMTLREAASEPIIRTAIYNAAQVLDEEEEEADR